jgi:ABC-2 type transport system permease protein
VFLMAGGLVMIGCSILITSMVKGIATAQALANFINIPLIFLSDMFLPVSILPPWLQSIVHWSPLYLFVEKYRAIYTGAYIFADVALWTFAIAVLGIALISVASSRFSWYPGDKGV